jgi:hypothetical protein
MRHTHSQQLERYLGAAHVERLSQSMRDWYGPPIAVNVPGKVWAAKGGDFIGPIEAGYEASAVDRAMDIVIREGRKTKPRRIIVGSEQMQQAGFTSLSDLIAEATTGKRREWHWQKAGSAGVVSGTNSLWGLGAQPAAGANAAAAPGGTVPTDALQGAPLIDNVSADTRHIVSAYASASVAGNNLLLYDRIFAVNKTMNSVANEAVTGVPTRYQSSTATNDDYAGGNFLFVEVGGTVLAGTAHNWGVAGGSNECLYRNQAGTDSQIMPVMTGNSGAIVRRLDHPLGSWFCPLAAGDTGVMDLAQMRCSASVATGVINFVIGHPLAWMPCPIANSVNLFDFIGTAFNLVRIFDDAAMAFLEVNKPATTATNYNMGITAVHG